MLVTSYQLFRSVVNYKFIDKFPSISEGLVNPGPDLVICDEGHILKNHSTATSKAVNCIKSLRRIVLTGTPLQNNLRECMYLIYTEINPVRKTMFLRFYFYLYLFIVFKTNHRNVCVVKGFFLPSVEEFHFIYAYYIFFYSIKTDI